MNTKGFSPGTVMCCGTVALALFLLTRSHAAGQICCVAAYIVALVSCSRNAFLYPAHSPIRLGWLALGANCFLSIFRHTVLSPYSMRLAGSQERVYLISQTLQFPALICVLLGIGMMWWGVYRLGLGFRVRWWECAGIVAIAAGITWAFRNDLSHTREFPGIVATLQVISLALLIAIAGAGLLLHGLSMQMGGGRLAVVMRCIALYALTRSLLTLSQAGRENFSPLWWMCFYAVPWIFAFGAACSCWLCDRVQPVRQQTI